MNWLQKMSAEIVRRSAPPVNETARKKASETYATLLHRFNTIATSQIRDSLDTQLSLKGIPMEWNDQNGAAWRRWTIVTLPGFVELRVDSFDCATSESDCIYYKEFSDEPYGDKKCSIYRTPLSQVVVPVIVGLRSLNEKVIKHRSRSVWVASNVWISDDYNCLWQSDQDTPRLANAILLLLTGKTQRRDFNPRRFIHIWE